MGQSSTDPGKHWALVSAVSMWRTGMKTFLSCGSVCVEVRWSWAIAREWDDKGWQWRNNNNTADHHPYHHLILQILADDSHQAIIIIIMTSLDIIIVMFMTLLKSD